MKKRSLSFDVIRITAIMMVVMLHVSTFMLVSCPDTNDAAFRAANTFNGICRAGTPLFLMLSGALLLDESKPFDTRVFYRRSLLAICLLLLFWLLFYASWRSFLLPGLSGAQPDYDLFPDYLLTLRGLYPHLWYLFMLAGAYLAIPVLRLFVKQENRSYILGMIVLALVSQFAARTLGILTRNTPFTVSDFISKFHVEYASGYLPFLLIGWYLTYCPIGRRARTVLYLFGLLSLVFIVLAVQICIDSIPEIHAYVAEMDTLPAVVYGAALFDAIGRSVGARETRSRIIRNLSKASFGVYVLHVVFLDAFTTFLLPAYACPGMHPLCRLFLIFCLTYGASLCVVLSLSRIPILRGLFYYSSADAS